MYIYNVMREIDTKEYHMIRERKTKRYMSVYNADSLQNARKYVTGYKKDYFRTRIPLVLYKKEPFRMICRYNLHHTT